MPGSATHNTPLPPSIEKAYHQKCVELKRRLKEVEQANDAARLRKLRLDRAIMKMRVNRAFLLEQLAKAQDPNGEASDRSSSPPPTPRERPPRLKRNYHRRSSPTNDQQQPASSSPVPEQATLAAVPSEAAADGDGSAGLPARSNTPNSRSQTHKPLSRSSQSPQAAGEYRQAAENSPYSRSDPPLIYSLPNGTQVVLIDGKTKEKPWTINDLDPRHHLDPEFEKLSVQDQDYKVRRRGYLPIDEYGHAILRVYDSSIGRYRHIFPDDSDYKDPVIDGHRIDPIEDLPPLSRIARERPSNGDEDDDRMQVRRTTSRHGTRASSNGHEGGVNGGGAPR